MDSTDRRDHAIGPGARSASAARRARAADPCSEALERADSASGPWPLWTKGSPWHVFRIAWPIGEPSTGLSPDGNETNTWRSANVTSEHPSEHLARGGREHDGTRRLRRAKAAVLVLAAGIAMTTGTGTAHAAEARNPSFETGLAPFASLGMRLDVGGDTTSAGDKIVTWYINGGSDQVWNVVQSLDDPTLVTLNNKGSNMCLTSDGVKGDQLTQERCDGSASQTFQTFDSYGEPQPMQHHRGYTYAFRNLESNLCVNLQGGSPAAGTHIINWDCNGWAGNNYFLEA